MTLIVVDTSALIAMVTGEPGADWLQTRLWHANERLMCTASAVELDLVLEGRFNANVGLGRRLLHRSNVALIPLDDDLAQRASDAWRRFGKGNHRAALNYGDCFTYALAEREALPILCTGDDFARTDLPTLTPP